MPVSTVYYYSISSAVAKELVTAWRVHYDIAIILDRKPNVTKLDIGLVSIESMLSSRTIFGRTMPTTCIVYCVIRLFCLMVPLCWFQLESVMVSLVF